MNNAPLLPDIGGLINTTRAANMTARNQVCKARTLALKSQKDFSIVFNPSLTSDPSSVQITVESSGKDGDFTYYIQSPNKNGCKIFFNPVQSASSTAASVIGTVTVHYFAMAG